MHFIPTQFDIWNIKRKVILAGDRYIWQLGSSGEDGVQVKPVWWLLFSSYNTCLTPPPTTRLQTLANICQAQLAHCIPSRTGHFLVADSNSSNSCSLSLSHWVSNQLWHHFHLKRKRNNCPVAGQPIGRMKHISTFGPKGTNSYLIIIIIIIIFIISQQI